MLRAALRSKSDWRRLWADMGPHREVEGLIGEAHGNAESWKHFGWCEVCNHASAFACDWRYSNGKRPNFREGLVCPSCALNSRQRMMMLHVRERLTAHERTRPATRPRLYLYEQMSPLYSILKARLDADVVGSEYLGHSLTPGEHLDGIRHEDALGLSFADESFDLAVSNDVLEHVPDVDQALEEAVRILRPGGGMLASIPFSYQDSTRQRARVSNGRLEHLEQPEYHGNPLSEQGSLVFYDFGWDLLERCRTAGFADAYFVCVHCFFRGYLGEDAGISLHAEKSAR
jgi:SAM-dependent methyltransferase